MEVFNLYDGELDEARTEPEGWRWRAAMLGPKLGAALLGATLYEVEPGERTLPLPLRVGLRGVADRRRGHADAAHARRRARARARATRSASAKGPAGAHLVANRSDDVVRVVILSNKARPAVAVYPDSDKIGIWTDGGDSALFRRGTAVDYWDGELGADLNSHKGA